MLSAMLAIEIKFLWTLSCEKAEQVTLMIESGSSVQDSYAFFNFTNSPESENSNKSVQQVFKQHLNK